MHIKKSMLVFAALIFASFSNICYASDMKWTYDEKTAAFQTAMLSTAQSLTQVRLFLRRLYQMQTRICRLI